MRWIKHPSAFSRSATMADVLEALGPSGYGATWLLLERIAESWDGSTEPELRISMKQWKQACYLSARKFEDLLGILKDHGIVFSKSDGDKLSLTAPILVELRDESTRKAGRNSGTTPEYSRKDSRLQTEPERDKEDNKIHSQSPNLQLKLAPVLERHGIQPSSERGRRIIQYVDLKLPNNPGGYLETILQGKPDFDPIRDEHQVRALPGHTGGEPISIREILVGWPPAAKHDK